MMDLDRIYSHHPPTPFKQIAHLAIREAARNFAQAIETHCPVGADASAAHRKVREAMMTANAAIALDGRL